MRENNFLGHLFKTRNFNYIYDTNTDMFLKVEKGVYDLLYKYDYNLDDDNVKNNNVIKELIDKGYLSTRRPEEIVHPLNDFIHYFVDNSVRMMILQVTQQCNLRCDYCVYSGNYDNRKHSSKEMSIDTAKKGIDFAIEHSRDCEILNIAFYGGEPLLRFGFIKECVEYTKQKGEGKKITFSMTTNGTLLRDEIVDFIYENDFNTLISLDGPKEIHDINRKFANGKGSFDTIMKNVDEITFKYPKYAKEKLGFNIVMDGKNDFCSINDFFADYESVKDLNVRATQVNQQYSKSKLEIEEKFIEDLNYERFKVLLEKMNRLDKRFTSKLLDSEFYKLSLTMDENRNKKNGLKEKMHHSGPCIPGITRLFMSVNGTLYPCERVSEESEMMKIGHVEEGFYLDKIKNLLNVGKITEDKCKNCWAIRYCYQCAASADNINELSAEKKITQCDGIKYSIEDRFIKYCTLNELGYNFE